MRLNKKGFTLVELLAVIVILGILLIVAIPATTTIIDNSRKDSFVSSGKMYISAMQNLVAAEMDTDVDYCATVGHLAESGNTKNPWGSGNVEGIVVYSQSTKKYTAYIKAGDKYADVNSDSTRSVVKDSSSNFAVDCSGKGTELAK